MTSRLSVEVAPSTLIDDAARRFTRRAVVEETGIVDRITSGGYLRGR